MKVALDTNILVYMDDSEDAERRDIAIDLLRRIPPEQILLPVQVLAEYYRVLTQKQGYPADEAREMLIVWIETFGSIETTPDIIVAAADITATGEVSFWDAIVLASAISAGCRILISEDMRSGFNFSGITVVDPFAETRHPLLELAFRG